MIINKNDLKAVLKPMNMLIFPRTFGSPHQIPISDFDTLHELFNGANGRSEVYIASNSSFMKSDGSRLTPTTVVVGDLFNDFDDKKKPENAMFDAIKLSRYLHNLQVNHVVLFSGNNGFHVHIILKPERVKYLDDERYYLNEFFKSIQNTMKSKLELRTMDAKVVGTPLKLCRMPYSYYHKKGYSNGNIVSILPSDFLFKCKIHEVFQYSRNPDLIIPKIEYDYINIFQLSEIVGASLDFTEPTYSAKIHEVDIEITDIIANEIIKSLKYKYPCVYNDMLSKNPKHTTRMQFALFCKSLGLDVNAINAIYEHLGKSVGYVDLMNRAYRIEQIKSVMRMSKPMRCKKLKESGICIGGAECVMKRGECL